jgi:NAD-dependent deacetylase
MAPSSNLRRSTRRQSSRRRRPRSGSHSKEVGGNSGNLSGTNATGGPSSTNGTPTTRRPVSRRRSLRGKSSLSELAKEIVVHGKRVVFITGAGLSVASGVRPFRGQSGVWTQHLWTTARRETFRKDPLAWYNEFWLPCLTLPVGVKPNAGHLALQTLLDLFPLNLRIITQNVDGLHPPGPQTIEAHGRVGLFKCIPDVDSDTDSESDDDDDRLVHLGHRRKRRVQRRFRCPYQIRKSLPLDEVLPMATRGQLQQGRGPLSEAPKCPACGNTLAPQALLFDEGYHSHDFYQFQKMEDWLAEAEVVVFVGTSFAVRLPEVTLEHARAEGIPVYNFNTSDMLDATVALDATNVRGAAEVTLPLLLQEVEQQVQELGMKSQLPLAGPKNQSVPVPDVVPGRRTSNRRRRAVWTTFEGKVGAVYPE